MFLDFGESPAKKQPRYELSKEMKRWISEDEANKKIWDELLQAANNNSVCVVLCVYMCMYNMYVCVSMCGCSRVYVCMHACINYVCAHVEMYT